MGGGADNIVYVLINEAMPGYVKIGRTNDITRRLNELDWTNIPLPFECGDHRVRARREFFRITPERIVAALRLAALEDVTPRGDLAVAEPVRLDLEEARARRSAFNFSMVNVPEGSVLTFTRDPEIKAIVEDAKRVRFNRELTSLSEAARLAFLQKGFAWKAVQGPLYWKFDGETLDERRRRMEEEAAS
jgi:hypothetical protein